LHKQLLNRRDELKKLVIGSSEGSSASQESVEDSGDAAIRETRQGLESHLAEMEYNELMQIRRAISLIKVYRLHGSMRFPIRCFASIVRNSANQWACPVRPFIAIGRTPTNLKTGLTIMKSEFTI
jgi:hypothetical protein